MTGLIRRGLEAEFWVLNEGDRGHIAKSIRHNDDFCTLLEKENGTFEYAHNQFELRSTPDEEGDARSIERGLVRRLDLLREVAGGIIVSSGTYQGIDEPPLDLSENMGVPNVFWSELNLVFPADVSTRYTSATHCNLSAREGSERALIEMYNRCAGIAPVLLYAFSTSPCVNGVDVGVWNRRQQIVDSKGYRCIGLAPGTYPLNSIEQYDEGIGEICTLVERELAEKNPSFFCNGGKTPRETIALFRKGEWGFYKLVSDRVVRINRGSDTPFFEVRCIDAQECPSMAAAAHEFSFLASQSSDLKDLLPLNERELNENIKQAVLFGPDGKVTIGRNSFSVRDYAMAVKERVLGGSNSFYAPLIEERFRIPAAESIRKIIKKQVPLIPLLEKCLRENVSVTQYAF